MLKATDSKIISEPLRKIIANVGWLCVDRIFRMSVGLFVGAWVARYLGVENFGLYNYALAFVALFTPLATLGLDNIVIRDIVRDPSCENETIGSAFALKFMGGIGLLLLSAMAIFWVRPGEPFINFIVALIAIGTIFQAFDVIDLWFQSQVQSKYAVYGKNCALLITTCIRVYLILTQASLIAFVITGLAEAVLGAVAIIFLYLALGKNIFSWEIKITRIKSLLKDSWALIIANMAILLYMKIDIIMLGNMAGNEAVGFYSAAVKISELWYFIPGIICSSCFPALIEAKNHSQDLYNKKLQKLFDFMVVLAFIVILLVTFSSDYLLYYLYGPEYATSCSLILKIHIWASLIVFIGVAQGQWETIEGLMALSLQKTLVGAMVNIILNLWLIPRYSGVGAAIATVLSYATSSLILTAYIRETRGIFLMQVRSLLMMSAIKKIIKSFA